MREIKFRALVDEMSDLAEDDPAKYQNLVWEYYSTFDQPPWLNLDIIVKDLQYTGLKDKNGKEIYEGDIVKYETNYYGNKREHKKAIEWSDDLEHDGFGEPLAVGYLFRGSNIEVIGNIYENGDLINA